MCLVMVCNGDERAVGRQPAPGACPYCGGPVQAVDVQRECRFCFVPLYLKTNRHYCCSICGQRPVVL